MIKNFSQYLVEEQREVHFTFGRMNPPTIGHGKVMDKLSVSSGKGDYKIYLSHSQNAKKDPLSYMDKVKHTRKMFPKHARSVILDKKIKNVFDVAVSLYDQGYVRINMVVGSDRVREFDVLLNKYNGTKARHGFYNFDKITIISAGERDPDAEGIAGMSASKQRTNASNNDFVAFSQGVPKSMSNKDAQELFNDVRKGMGLAEEREFKRHVELPSVSERRESYIKGTLFAIGDTVVIKESEELATVCVLGANYLVVECNGIKLRKWLDSVELLDKEGVVEYTSTIESVKKKKSMKFKDMFDDVSVDEGSDPVADAKEKIEREKSSDKKKHDRILDRARTATTKIKNKETK